MALDSKDLSVLSELKADSRQTIREIARKTKIRPSTVHQRLKRLRESRVIERFTVKLDNKAVGENFVVFMLVKTDGQIDNRFFRDEHVKEVFGITGEYDLLMKLKFRDIEQFNTYVLDVRKVPGIRNTVTMVGTVNIKEEL
ncbi:MAG: Lrp/AsnC family transcriptional regulator [Candidatus Woesearchaeota archaeon]